MSGAALNWEQRTYLPHAECITDGCEWASPLNQRGATDDGKRHARDNAGHTVLVTRVSESLYVNPVPS